MPDLTIKLPSMPLAIHLFEKFEEVFCDCHWFMRQDFREHLVIFYSNPHPQTSNRKWLCLASLVFALASTFMYEQDSHDPNTCAKISTPGADVSWETPLPPGFGLFEQARKVFITFSENPSTEDIEILNLMVCYDLSQFHITCMPTNQR